MNLTILNDKQGCHDSKYFMSANRYVLFMSTPNNRRIYKTTKKLKFHIVKISENDKYVKYKRRVPVNGHCVS